MRKLLLLLPALTLESCSSAHDLMSNKPFRMTCAEDGKVGAVLLVSPDLLSQATLLTPLSMVMPELSYELAVKTPVRLELHLPMGQGISQVIAINRESGEVSGGTVRPAEGSPSLVLTPMQENTKCTFETL